MIALVGLGDQLVDLALGDLVEDAVALADRQQDGVEHLVEASQKLRVFAAKGGDVCALAQLSVLRRLDQAQDLLLELLIGAFACQPRP